MEKQKRRVLLIITKLAIGGATNVVLDIADHLNTHPNFIVHLAAGPVAPPEVSLTHVVLERGIPLKNVPGMGNQIDPLLNLKAFMQLRYIIAEGRYDIVHTHSSVAGVIGRMAAASMKVPVIIHHVHGWGLQEDMSHAMRATYISLERMCARYTSRMIGVSWPTVQKGLQLSICPEDKFTLIYNGINLDKFTNGFDGRRTLHELGLKPDCKIVGMIGRLDRQKNPLDFIKASALVAKDYDGVQFVIVGDGVLRSECERLIHELNLSDRILLLGYRSDVERIHNIMTVFALSSLWEGLPIVFQEAMSAGNPIVANNVDGASDVIRDGETGYLVRPHHPEEMASRILSLLKDEAQCRRMGEAARRYSERFSVQTMTERIESVYQELLDHTADDTSIRNDGDGRSHVTYAEHSTRTRFVRRRISRGYRSISEPLQPHS